MRSFECLKCGLVSTLTALPARCPQCGHGSGIIHNSVPGRAAGVSLPVIESAFRRNATAKAGELGR